jgi:hypothetical protein
VQVVEHEHQRRVGPGFAEQRGDRLEEPQPAAVRVTRVLAAREPSRSRSGSSDAPDDQPRTISTTGWYGASASSSKRP